MSHSEILCPVGRWSLVPAPRQVHVSMTRAFSSGLDWSRRNLHHAAYLRGLATILKCIRQYLSYTH